MDQRIQAHTVARFRLRKPTPEPGVWNGHFLRHKALWQSSKGYFFVEMVGAIGFEPTTPCSRSRCATRLRYAPTLLRMDAGVESESVSLGGSLDRNTDSSSLAEIGACGGLPRRCDAVAAADIMKEYESQPRARLLLPDDLGRPVSTLAISSLPASNLSFDS